MEIGHSRLPSLELPCTLTGKEFSALLGKGENYRHADYLYWDLCTTHFRGHAGRKNDRRPDFGLDEL